MRVADPEELGDADDDEEELLVDDELVVLVDVGLALLESLLEGDDEPLGEPEAEGVPDGVEVALNDEDPLELPDDEGVRDDVEVELGVSVDEGVGLPEDDADAV